jgi:hypothetical protein
MSDESLRRLERLAAAGDTSAADALVRSWNRIGSSWMSERVREIPGRGKITLVAVPTAPIFWISREPVKRAIFEPFIPGPEDRGDLRVEGREYACVGSPWAASFARQTGLALATTEEWLVAARVLPGDLTRPEWALLPDGRPTLRGLHENRRLWRYEQDRPWVCRELQPWEAGRYDPGLNPFRLVLRSA